jgi:lipoprotein-anchoring transpeptidase ErfK/SrfK
MANNPAHSPSSDQPTGLSKNPQESRNLPNSRSQIRHSKINFRPLLIIFFTVTIASIAVIILLAGISYGLYKYYYTSDLIAPGINVLGTDIGAKNSLEAAIILHKTWNLDRLITAKDGVNTLRILPGEIGIQVDPIATIKNAKKIGRTGGFLTDVEQIISSYQNGRIIAPVVILDYENAKVGLENLAPKMSRSAKNAMLQLDGGELIEVPGEIGYTINVKESIDLFNEDPYSIMIYGSANIVLKPVLPYINDVSDAIEQANRLLDSSASIHAYDPITNERSSWQVSREDIRHWLSIDSDENGPVVSLDEDLAAGFFIKINNQIGPERSIDGELFSSQLVEAVINNGSISTVINYNRTTYSVKKGDTLLKIAWKLGFPLWKILEVNPGLDPDNVIAGTELIIPAKDELLPLPIVANKRIIISISKQRLWAYENGELLGKHLISTGIDKSPTQPGIFQVQSHSRNAYASVWDLHMPNFIGIYEAWPGFMNGIHGLPTLSSGTRLWENVLGEPASFGCIILDLDTSEWLYDWADEGVIVEIVP